MHVDKKNMFWGALLIVLISTIIYLCKEVNNLKKEYKKLENKLIKSIKSERIDQKTFALKMFKEYQGLIAFVNYTHNNINEKIKMVEGQLLELNKTKAY